MVWGGGKKTRKEGMKPGGEEGKKDKIYTTRRIHVEKFSFFPVRKIL